MSSLIHHEDSIDSQRSSVDSDEFITAPSTPTNIGNGSLSKVDSTIWKETLEKAVNEKFKKKNKSSNRFKRIVKKFSCYSIEKGNKSQVVKLDTETMNTSSPELKIKIKNVQPAHIESVTGIQTVGANYIETQEITYDNPTTNHEADHLVNDGITNNDIIYTKKDYLAIPDSWKAMNSVATDVMNLLWNGEFQTCEDVMSSCTKQLPTHTKQYTAKHVVIKSVLSNGKGFFRFLNAVLTFEAYAIEQAIAQLTETEKILNWAKSHSTTTKAIQQSKTAIRDRGWFGSSNGNESLENINLRKLNIEMMRADSILLLGIVYLLEGRISSYLKAANALRKGYNSYDSIYKQFVNRKDVAELIAQQDTQSEDVTKLINDNVTEWQSVYHGTRIGKAICSFMISLLPPKAKSIIAVFGIVGSRRESLQTLAEEVNYGSYKSPIAAFVLVLCFTELLRYVEMRVPRSVLQASQQVAMQCLTNYPKSNLFRVLLCKSFRIQGQYDRAVGHLTLVQDSLPPLSKDTLKVKTTDECLRVMCTWDLCITLINQHDFDSAIQKLDELVNTTDKQASKVFYMFLRCSCLVEKALGNPDPISLDVRNEIDEQLESTRLNFEYLKKKNPFEHVMERRIIMQIEDMKQYAINSFRNFRPFSLFYEVLYYMQELNDQSVQMARHIIARLPLDNKRDKNDTRNVIKRLLLGKSYCILMHHEFQQCIDSTTTVTLHDDQGQSMDDRTKTFETGFNHAKQALEHFNYCKIFEGNLPKGESYLVAQAYFEHSCLLFSFMEEYEALYNVHTSTMVQQVIFSNIGGIQYSKTTLLDAAIASSKRTLEILKQKSNNEMGDMIINRTKNKLQDYV